MDQPTPPQSSPPRAVILRCYLDDTGQLRGRIDDPAADSRAAFSGGDELVALVMRLVSQGPQPEGKNP